jgi:hypothetical protein
VVITLTSHSRDTSRKPAAIPASIGLVVFTVIALFVGSVTAEIQVTCHPPSLWGAADADLGVAGGLVEDFEDVNLVAGLQVEISDVDGNFTGTGMTILPAVFDPVLGDPFGDSFVEGVWDGSRVLVNTEGNQSIYYGSSDWRPVAFLVPAGTAWIGFSMQQVTGNHELFVNGNPQGRLEALGCAIGAGRNGYLVVSSDDSTEPIMSVSFGRQGDAFTLDHLVFADPDEVSLAALTWGMMKALFR